MNPLVKQGYLKGVREEFVRQGYSYADARALSSLVLCKNAQAGHDFDPSFYEKLGRRIIAKQKKRALASRVLSAMPWILGAGAAGTLFLTPWGNRRLVDLVGDPKNIEERIRNGIKPGVYFDNPGGGNAESDQG